MYVYFSPQLNDINKVKYSFEGENIVVEMDDVVDEFDFTGFGDGNLDVQSIQTTLPMNPIISCKRENGILKVKLLNFITEDSPESDMFPEWKEIAIDG